MNVSLAFILIGNLLALSFTLSVLLLLVLWRNWRTPIGRALFQILASLLLLQSGTLLTHGSLLAESSRTLTRAALNITVLGFFLVILASLALLLRAAHALEHVWLLGYRSGLAAVFILQPAVWQHHIFDLPATLDHDLFGSPFTDLGLVVMVFSLIYAALVLSVGGYYWQRIDAPLLIVPVMLVTLTQVASLLFGSVRELTLTGIVGGGISGFLGFYLILRFDLTPQSPPLHWMRTFNASAIDTTGTLSLDDIMTNIAEEIRRLIRTDTLAVLLAIGPDRLEVTAVAGHGITARGRQIRIGEGLAGRVMQTLQPMRVDSYQNWPGRAIDFADLPYCASMSVPLIYAGHPVGVLNAHEIKPGRVFNEQDQAVLEMLAPLLTINVVRHQLANEQHTLRAYVDALMAQDDAALMIFNASGRLKESNAIARDFLRALFGQDNPTPTAIAVAALAHDDSVTNVLVQWATHPETNHTLRAFFPAVGPLTVQLQSVPDPHADTFALLLTLRKPPD